MKSPPALIFSTPGAIIIGSVIISLAILVSGGIIRLKSTTSTTPNTQAPGQTAPTAPEPTENLGPVKVSIDDDPILGDKNAKVTLIEFSDYECPFCKRHFDQTLPQLKKDYIDTGKVKLVYRDFPLSFHDPMATTEAMAANCAKEQGGDDTYFKYHDEIFKRTTSNGNGLTKDDLYKIADDLNLNSSNLKTCLDADKYRDEVQKDIADGSRAGVSGTPGFFLGKTTSGSEIEGIKIVGAQPFSSFKTQIDKLLQ